MPHPENQHPICFESRLPLQWAVEGPQVLQRWVELPEEGEHGSPAQADADGNWRLEVVHPPEETGGGVLGRIAGHRR
ncbi:hypothetical protein EMIHUDRAFT_224545 [Emiliania huxleyi CCMP1516]|uniref:Uncharacterized protein n=2 Tax=Emiliania huxleyi TaxID=2903 RepID=A0A0D3KRS6_EMIH1|nr:hypothetical protein EMIHUDRAFT_224545 [Emiliania huxleyi CCMP1516]EOD38461.1 hypothetical protein EMIHUDRAFT_224545 [Emiliania huxleyi CCMP1516]|eukprot:XP_005790890.1 hypothetical protein EMIHUDRAFT_224545 [Emiliania huxleyi CCMP1516]